MIGQLSRIRPRFGIDQLTLHRGTGELSYLPDEFAPHTLTADLTTDKGENECKLVFEYSFDETVGYPHVVGSTSVVLGRYTGKVVSLTIKFTTRKDLIKNLGDAGEWLRRKANELNKDSYKKNYELVCTVLRDFAHALDTKQELMSQFSD